MNDVIGEILNRVSWMEWDEKTELFRRLCDYVGEQEALGYILRNNVEAAALRTTLENLHWQDAWSSFERAHLGRLFRFLDVDCVFDIGANAGQYAERLRNEIGFAGHIISFEPIPELAAVLRDKARGDANWHVLEVALAQAEGESTFNVMAASEFSSLLEPTTEEVTALAEMNAVSRTVRVRTSTLDQQFTNFQSLGFTRPFLKMDTQGGDLNVVTGGNRWLNRFVGLQSELSIKRLYSGAPTFTESLRCYQEHGFVLSALVPNNAGHFPTLLEIDCLMFRPKAG